MPKPLAYLNGRFIPAAEFALSPTDAGFVYAATATDFCRTYSGRLFRWSEHLDRFHHDCAALHILLPYRNAELTAAADRLVKHNYTGEELAIITFATPGPLGYLLGLPNDGPATIGMHTFPLPAHRYERFFTEGVTLAVVGDTPAGILPVSVKHRSRLHWWLASKAVSEPGAVPVLLGPGGAPDTAIGNVLAVEGSIVCRPEPGTVLEGISLQAARECCAKVGLGFAQRRFDLADPTISELLLTGSGFGIAGVRRVIWPDRVREFTWPGPATPRLLAAWTELVRAEIESPSRG